MTAKHKQLILIGLLDFEFPEVVKKESILEVDSVELLPTFQSNAIRFSFFFEPGKWVD